MAARAARLPAHVNTSPFYFKQLQRFSAGASVTLFATIVAAAFLSPFLYMVMTSLKTQDQIVASARGSIFPMSPVTVEYEGEDLPIYSAVPTPDGPRRLALVQERRRGASLFIDPDNLDAGVIELEITPQVFATLQAEQKLDVQWSNFGTAWDQIGFPRLIYNTLMIALWGIIGTLASCIAVAYAFARFPIPGKNILFLVLIATIILPRQITLVPTYAFFNQIGWTGTWLPLIVPHFFSNAYNVFLLRQYFLTLPRELDEAAMIDGAGPFRILVSVIIPQSWPAIVAVGLFHFVFAWNDYFEPLIYTLSAPDKRPLSVGVQQLNYIYDQQPHLIQATALMGLVLPVMLFLLAQRFFMQGVRITGVEK
jgi:multiple sugar transport system permease protein